MVDGESGCCGVESQPVGIGLGCALGYKLNFHGTDTDTDTDFIIGMRLLCNFVNVYTTVYHVQYTYTCTRAHPQRTSSRGKVRVGQKSADMSSRRAERARADFRVGVGVRVRVGPVEFKLIASLATMTASLGVTCVRADS